MSSMIPGGLGLNTFTQTVQQAQSSLSNFQSVYNNGFTRMGFKIQSFLPSPSASVNFQAKEFNNYAFDPILQYLGQQGLLALPESLMFSNPTGIPTYSEMTNWGANPMGYPVPSPMPYPQPQAMGYPVPSPMPYPQPQAMGYPVPSPMSYPQPQAMGYPVPSPMPYPQPQAMGYPAPSPMSYPQPFPILQPPPLPLNNGIIPYGNSNTLPYEAQSASFGMMGMQPPSVAVLPPILWR